MRRGIALLLLFFLLLPVPSEPNPLLLTRTLIYGSKIIRVSVPFSLTRLKAVYQVWKNKGRPAFSKLKIPLSTAVIYIGASYLANEFEKLYQKEQQADNPLVFPSDAVQVCLELFYEGASLTGSYCAISLNLSSLTATVSSSPCQPYTQPISFSLRLFRNDGSFYQITGSAICANQSWICGSQGVHVSLSVRDYIASIPSCSVGSIPVPDSLTDDDFLPLLPGLSNSNITAYPAGNDPLDPALDIPTTSGDSVTIEDTNTGETSTETTTDQGTDTKTDQMDIPADNSYNPDIDVPEKQSIPDLISNFIQNSPLMRWIQGASISASSGSCSVSGTFLNRSIVIDFCPLAPYLNTIGSFILAFAHIYALYIIFRIR